MKRIAIIPAQPGVVPPTPREVDVEKAHDGNAWGYTIEPELAAERDRKYGHPSQG